MVNERENRAVKVMDGKQKAEGWWPIARRQLPLDPKYYVTL